jgi:hypothetical protein
MLLDNFYQIAYLTRDIDQAMATIRGQAEVRSEFYYEADMPVRRPSGPEQMHVKLAMMWVGNIQYEVIQPISGLDDIYGAFVPGDESLAFHHTCVRVPDWESFRRSVEDQPYPIAFEGGNGPNYFLYLDARGKLGHFLEYAYLPDDMWVQMGGR